MRAWRGLWWRSATATTRVAGRGLTMLRDAGIEVARAFGSASARDNIGFFSRIELGRPMVTLKLANSFDGRIATATGESQWITQAQRAVWCMPCGPAMMQ